MGQRQRQAEERARAGGQWQDHNLVFTTSVGTAFESHNLRREFWKLTAAAGLGSRWVPKEPRATTGNHDPGRGDGPDLPAAGA